MPQQSKYSDHQYEQIMQQVIAVLEDNQSSPDLSLMVLGNIVSNILQLQIPAPQRSQMAEKFTQVLLKSIQNN